MIPLGILTQQTYADGDYAPSTLLPKVEAAWDVDEASGTRFDLHNSHDIAPIASVGSVAGKISNAMSFGASSEAKTGAGWPTGIGSFAMTFFMQPSAGTTGFVVHRAGYNNTGATVPGSWVVIGGVGSIYFEISDDGSFNDGGGTRVTSPTTMSAGTAYHVYLHYNSVNDELAISVNNEAPIVTTLANTFFNVGDSLRFGRLTATYPNPYQGWLDCIRYYNEPLTQAERDWEYNNGNGRSYADFLLTPAFNPNSISGLQTWLDGSDPGVTANEWQDKATGGRGNYTKHPSYTMPTHDAGDDSIRFAGSHVINGPSYSDMTEGEIFVRLKTDAGDHGLWYFSNKNDNGDWYPYTGSSAYLGWGQNTRPSFGIGVPFTSYHTLNIWSATNDWAANVNGVNRATDTSTIVGFVSAPYIGKMAAASYWLSGNIKALCIFDRKLTTEERTQMNDYMDAL